MCGLIVIKYVIIWRKKTSVISDFSSTKTKIDSN